MNLAGTGFKIGKIGGEIQFSTNVDRLKLQQMLLPSNNLQTLGRLHCLKAVVDADLLIDVLQVSTYRLG